MKIKLLSDLHLEHYEDKGEEYLANLEAGECDILVLAGDITSWNKITEHLTRFCEVFPRVVYVLGNHEFYAAPTRNHVLDACQEAVEKNKNLFWLNNSSAEIGGKKFYGGPMWFPQSLEVFRFANHMNDFFYIKDFSKWVYEENLGFVQNLEESKADVVVSHYLPSPKSVAERFKHDRLNVFFLCDVEKEMQKLGPSLWLHGHTHDSFDYELGDTRVVCNPFGYVSSQKNSGFDQNKVIEIS